MRFRLLFLTTILSGLFVFPCFASTGDAYTPIVLPAWIVDNPSLDHLATKVFQINVYKYDEAFNRYTPIQYGSAVLIDTDKIVTNAHVVYKSSTKETYFYQVCKITSIKDNPVCFSPAKLIRLDTTDDLALLTIQDPEWLPNPVILGSTDQTIGDTVHVLWYPANWWTTITATRWTIAWYIKWYYKIDANLDEWNSGWGAFDDSWYLVWIPSYLQDWYSSLWYILDVKLVRSFLEGTLWTSINLPISNWFINYLSKTQVLNAQAQIENSFFTTQSFNGVLTLSSAIENDSAHIYKYQLNSLDDSVSIVLQTTQRSSKTTPQEYAGYLSNYYTKNWLEVSSSNKVIQGNRWIILSILHPDTNQLTYTYIQNSNASNVFFEATIDVDSDANKQTVSNAIDFIQTIMFRKIIANHPPLLTPQLGFAWQKYAIFKSLTDKTVSAFFVSENNSFYGLLQYASQGVTSTKWTLSGLVNSLAYSVGTDKPILQYSNQNTPYYTISYADDLNNNHVLAVWLVKYKSMYYSIVADLLWFTKDAMIDAKKALQALKVTSLIK